MWIELPLPKVGPTKMQGNTKQGAIICSACGCTCTVWMVAGWEQWGCSHCGTLPSGPEYTKGSYFKPTMSLIGWNHADPIPELLKAGRIYRCSCNNCKGSFFVGEAV